MALPCSIKAPEFRLKSTTGKPVILSEVLKRGPVVLAFFKVSCPVCQYAFPYLERMSQVHKPEPVSFIGISQDSPADTEAFLQKYGVSFTVALDDSKRYVVSNAYKLTNVRKGEPAKSLFEVPPDYTVQAADAQMLKRAAEQDFLKQK